MPSVNDFRKSLEIKVISKETERLELIQKQLDGLFKCKNEIQDKISLLETEEKKAEFIKNNKEDIDWVNKNIQRLVGESITPTDYWDENGHIKEAAELLSD